MSDPVQLLTRIQRFLEDQQDIYAPFISGLKAGEIPPEITEPVTETAAETKQPESAPQPKSNQMTLESCTTLDELRSLCEQESSLRTDLPDTNLVFGVGNPAADLMIIGEAPGANEDKQGEPFVGRAGQLLNKILEAINFKREDIYIANILKHRPPDNRNPLPEERERSLPYLEKQIDIIQPKLILCLGLVSAHTLLETTEALKDLRSKFHTYRNKYELTVTYHPAALLRNPNWKRSTWEDVQLLRKRYDELGCKP